MIVWHCQRINRPILLSWPLLGMLMLLLWSVLLSIWMLLWNLLLILNMRNDLNLMIYDVVMGFVHS